MPAVALVRSTQQMGLVLTEMLAVALLQRMMMGAATVLERDCSS